MRIKLDENLPAILVPDLVALGHDVDTAVDEGLGGRDDPSVWAAAQETGRVLVTQDLDFSDVRAFVPGTHHGLVLVRRLDQVDQDGRQLPAHPLQGTRAHAARRLRGWSRL